MIEDQNALNRADGTIEKADDHIGRANNLRAKPGKPVPPLTWWLLMLQNPSYGNGWWLWSPMPERSDIHLLCADIFSTGNQLNEEPTGPQGGTSPLLFK